MRKLFKAIFSLIVIVISFQLIVLGFFLIGVFFAGGGYLGQARDPANLLASVIILSIQFSLDYFVLKKMSGLSWTKCLKLITMISIVAWLIVGLFFKFAIYHPRDCPKEEVINGQRIIKLCPIG